MVFSHSFLQILTWVSLYLTGLLLLVSITYSELEYLVKGLHTLVLLLNSIIGDSLLGGCFPSFLWFSSSWTWSLPSPKSLIAYSSSSSLCCLSFSLCSLSSLMGNIFITIDMMLMGNDNHWFYPLTNFLSNRLTKIIYRMVFYEDYISASINISIIIIL